MTAIPPEFLEYYAFMEKHNYSKYAKKKHISNAKRIGYLLLNQECIEPIEIARTMCDGSKASQNNLAWTLNDYRVFLDEKNRPQKQIEILMSLKDKVLV